MSYRTAESFSGPPDAAGLPNQLQWGALQRLSLPGRNCGVIELRDNNTFFSLISYQRWIINTIIIMPSHQQRSADASTLPPPELTCSFTRFSFLSIALVPLILFPFPLAFTFPHFVLSTTHPSHLSPAILPVSVPLHWIQGLRGIEKLHYKKKKSMYMCEQEAGGKGREVN